MHRQEIELALFDGGFTIISETGESRYSWNEIEQIVTYKIDMFVTDEICLDIILPGSILTLTESDSSWEVFIATMQNELSSIDPDWWSKVAYPAFETNERTIYKKLV